MPFTRPTFPPSVDPQLKRALTDITRALNDHQTTTQQLHAQLAAIPPEISLHEIAARLSASGSHPLPLSGLIGTPAGVGSPASGPPVTVAPTGTPPDPTTFSCNIDVTKGQPSGVPARPNKRWMRGDFCGIDVPGMPSTVSVGGPLNANLITCFQYGFYDAGQRATILASYVAHGYTHFVLSWPDLRDRTGLSPAQAIVLAQEVVAAGLYPVWFLLAKDFDNASNIAPSCDPIINAAQVAGVYSIACVGWELSLWMTPTQVQDAVDHVCAFGTEANGVNVYVHFQEGYPSFQQPGLPTHAFWDPNVGKLTGLLYQKTLSQDCGMWQARTNDIQIRFNGAAGFPHDSGFGHPFDLVQYEYSASPRFNGNLSEGSARTMGLQAIGSPPEGSPSQGVGVQVSGFLNGGPNL